MITEEQREARKLGIGGSDMSIILGLSSYKTPLELYLEKKGQLVSSYVETDLQYWGHQLEVVIRKEFRKRNRVQVITPKDTFVHPFYDFLRGNLDGFIPKWNAVFEAKNSNQFMAQNWGEHGTDIIPMEYLVQVAFYCSILNSPCAYIAVLIGGHDYREFKYTRDLELEGSIIKAAVEFWRAVENDLPPPATNHSDLKILYPRHDPNKIIKINTDIAQQLTDLHATRSKIKELEAIESKYKFNIMQHMQDAECLTDESGKPVCTWKANKKGARTFLLKGV